MSPPPVWISGARIAELAPLPGLIDELRVALRTGERAHTSLPPRTLIIHDAPFRAFGAMCAYSAERELFVTKVAAFVEPSAPTERASVHAQVVLASGRTGEIVAIADGAAITALKSAAVAAVVAAHCAPASVGSLAVIGSGVQADAIVRGIAAVRAPRELRVYSRDPRNVDRFAARIGDAVGGAAIARASSADAAIEGADVVVTATTSRTPVFARGALPAHVHVHCGGAHTASSREVPRTLLDTACLIVEDVATAIAEAGDVHARALDLERMLATPGLDRCQTLFSSTGHAFIDLIAAAHVWRAVSDQQGARGGQVQ